MKFRKTATVAHSLLLLGTLLAGLSFAYGDTAEAILKATPDQHDFGTIAEEDNAVFTTTVQNVGNTPVEITNVRTS